ncbi:MAG: hypothetical protein QF632_03960 [Candidatus Woesearchaeota archaeon]|jgi:hypothetical protein|nr:hypothetical protein [Candidatus Woesearchaeota archaeon]MDP7323886.1 hypothetical protein [Candidatus Woesearchaeota archaeon]MDP7457206.1 hypothetical protein [Candidatus Woesearchaeota archaeon]|tara:strand:+ start:408 stop:833 length:426 start_codon:yes stop_codon:yes gene_type:complete
MELSDLFFGVMGKAIDLGQRATRTGMYASADSVVNSGMYSPLNHAMKKSALYLAVTVSLFTMSCNPGHGPSNQKLPHQQIKQIHPYEHPNEASPGSESQPGDENLDQKNKPGQENNKNNDKPGSPGPLPGIEQPPRIMDYA